jgi:hypothetical protein
MGSLSNYCNEISKMLSQRRPVRDVLKTVLKVLSAKPNTAENFRTSRVTDLGTSIRDRREDILEANCSLGRNLFESW